MGFGFKPIGEGPEPRLSPAAKFWSGFIAFFLVLGYVAWKSEFRWQRLDLGIGHIFLIALIIAALVALFSKSG